MELALEALFRERGESVWWFQSLFLWNSPSKIELDSSDKGLDGFQSLFLWNSPRSPLAMLPRAALSAVSILVFVELALEGRMDSSKRLALVRFQSLFLWNSPSKGGGGDMSKNGDAGVSILVFVELALEGGGSGSSLPDNQVSILVFVELALEVSLNPSSTGHPFTVSILVFVELALEVILDIDSSERILEFQSLFLWNSPSKAIWKYGHRNEGGFQSLFLWNSPSK